MTRPSRLLMTSVAWRGVVDGLSYMHCVCPNPTVYTSSNCQQQLMLTPGFLFLSRGRVFSFLLFQGYRKVKLCCEDVQGTSVLTNFHGMDLTRDKLCSLIKKWQTLIEAQVDVRTTDGYLLRIVSVQSKESSSLYDVGVLWSCILFSHFPALYQQHFSTLALYQHWNSVVGGLSVVGKLSSREIMKRGRTSK